MPFFSVVLITYNRADLLPRCIESVVNQTFTDWELIIVDNHSEDGTKELVEDYMVHDSRIRFTQVHNNNVIAISRNTGIKMARGMYICTLDSDDWYYHDKLEKAYAVCREGKYDVLYSKFQIMSPKGEGGVFGQALGWDDPFCELLLLGNKICNTTTIIKKSAWEDVGYISESPELTAVEDIDGFLKLAKTNHTFYFINDVLVYYWVGDNNLSYSPKQIKRVCCLFDKWLPVVDEDKKNKVIGSRDFLCGRLYHRGKNWENARGCYLKVLKNHQSMKKPQAFILLVSSFLHISI